MWLLFDGPKLVAYSKRESNAPAGAIVQALPAHLESAIYRAGEKGRVTYDGGVRLDGALWTPPASEPDITYTQAIAAINASTLPAGLKAWMRLVTELLLDHGKVEL